ALTGDEAPAVPEHAEHFAQEGPGRIGVLDPQHGFAVNGIKALVRERQTANCVCSGQTRSRPNSSEPDASGIEHLRQDIDTMNFKVRVRAESHKRLSGAATDFEKALPWLHAERRLQFIGTRVTERVQIRGSEAS